MNTDTSIRQCSRSSKIALLLLVCASRLSNAWVQQRQPAIHRFSHGTLLATNNDNNDNSSSDNRNPLSRLLSPYDSKIPPELRQQIYAAEANTPAAQQRGVRIAGYALIAFTGIVLAFFNAFVTELRNAPLPEQAPINADPLTVAGFAWVANNPITSFLFMNKLGGGICLILGAVAGLLAEAELDTKRINSEKIFEEMQRRRQLKTKNKEATAVKKKKGRSGKEKKRMDALSELMQVQEPVAPTVENQIQATPITTPDVQSSNEEGKGLLGKLKGFYDQADSMAASQALLLNKDLEDRGLIEKITDETGLKVVGRQEAAKRQEASDKKQSANGE
jgi:hypothetical protein